MSIAGVKGWTKFEVDWEKKQATPVRSSQIKPVILCDGFREFDKGHRYSIVPLSSHTHKKAIRLSL